MKRLIWGFIILYCISTLIALSWFLWINITEQLEMRAMLPRHERVEKIILDGRGPELKRVMREAVK